MYYYNTISEMVIILACVFFLCLKIVQIDLVNGFVNCAKYGYMFILYVQMKLILIKKCLVCVYGKK